MDMRMQYCNAIRITQNHVINVVVNCKLLSFWRRSVVDREF